jgi:hypothetical protein
MQATGHQGNRIAAVGDEVVGARLPVLSGYFLGRNAASPLTFQQCIESIMRYADLADVVDIDEFRIHIEVSEDFGRDQSTYGLATRLTEHQIAALSPYTSEAAVEGRSFYNVVNTVLRTRRGIEPFVDMIWLLSTALSECEESDAGVRMVSEWCTEGSS